MTYDPVKWLRDNASAPSKTHEPDSPESRALRNNPTRPDKLQEKMMGPDHSRTGIFVYHNCAYCRDGELPCKQGAPNRCDNPRARND